MRRFISDFDVAAKSESAALSARRIQDRMRRGVPPDIINASAAQEFEQAAQLRDRIRELRTRHPAR